MRLSITDGEEIFELDMTMELLKKAVNFFIRDRERKHEWHVRRYKPKGRPRGRVPDPSKKKVKSGRPRGRPPGRSTTTEEKMKTLPVFELTFE